MGWLLFFQWAYVRSKPGMLAAFVTTEYRATVNFRMLAVPVTTTLTASVCFWSAGISVAIYLLLLPLYMLPGKFEYKRTFSSGPSSTQRNPRDEERDKIIANN